MRKRDKDATATSSVKFAVQGKDNNRVAVVRNPTRPRVISLEAIDLKSIEEDDDELDNLCSYCNVGVVEKNFTFAGILLCFICFPCGFAWLFYLREEQCNNCGKMYH